MLYHMQDMKRAITKDADVETLAQALFACALALFACALLLAFAVCSPDISWR